MVEFVWLDDDVLIPLVLLAEDDLVILDLAVYGAGLLVPDAAAALVVELVQRNGGAGRVGGVGFERIVTRLRR